MKKILGIIVVLFMGFGIILCAESVMAKNLDLSMVQSGDILLGRNPNSTHLDTCYFTHAALVVDKNTTIEILGEGYYVDFYSITNWIKDFQDGDYTRVVVLRVKNISSYHITAAINKAKEQWGKGYGWLWSFAKYPYTPYHYCSSLIYNAYKWGIWIDLDCNGGPYVLPDDIFSDSDVKLISIQWQ